MKPLFNIDEEKNKQFLESGSTEHGEFFHNGIGGIPLGVSILFQIIKTIVFYVIYIWAVPEAVVGFVRKILTNLFLHTIIYITYYI